jgi:chemotaxis protein methyltransferase CheR
MDFQTFRDQVSTRLKLDLNSYKETQLKRRIDSLMSRRKIEGYRQYLHQLVTEPKVFGEFVDYLTINVTEFFRDKKPFEHLEKTILPEMFRKKSQLKIWSAACSNGAEPYSLAIILSELTPEKKHRIEATDLDPGILKVAAEGRYPADLLRNMAPGRVQKYLKQENGFYYLDAQTKSRVQFRRHDLLSDSYGSGYDLIVCRNVQIYFTREAQEKINVRFCKALVPGGILFLGSSETIFNYTDLGFERMVSCFYRKK